MDQAIQRAPGQVRALITKFSTQNEDQHSSNALSMARINPAPARRQSADGLVSGNIAFFSRPEPEHGRSTQTSSPILTVKAGAASADLKAQTPAPTSTSTSTPKPTSMSALSQQLVSAAGPLALPPGYQPSVLPPPALQKLFNTEALIPIELPRNPGASALAIGLPGWIAKLKVHRLLISEKASADFVSPASLAARLRLLSQLLNALALHPQAQRISVRLTIDLVFETGREQEVRDCSRALIALMEGLATDKTVTDLKLSGFHMSIDVLLHALTSNTRVETLDLRGNVLIAYSVFLLGQALEKNTQLRSLNLNGASLWSCSLASLVNSLHKNQGLQWVDLRGSQIAPAQITMLDTLMQGRPGLVIEFDRPLSGVQA